MWVTQVPLWYYFDDIFSQDTVDLKPRNLKVLFPQIAEHIRQVLDEVLYQSKDPKEALDNAAAKSAKTLGW